MDQTEAGQIGMTQATEAFLRIEAIFHEALAAPAAARPGLITARSGGDRTLSEEVYALLEACDAEEIEATQHRLGAEGGRVSDPKRIGPYVLDNLLGRGGMGAVYLAHRDDGQFDQKVAIKLIDLPLATDLFRERFRQERQILAGLQHPFIARLLDGGVTPVGDLYLAMEYVDGVPIHRFCNDRQLNQAQRLVLFMQVCEAVQFAHQNFVVHRDLKPDNIFVAEDGTPRLLDFGTAKLTSPSLPNPGSEMTREGFQSFTPQYASPEQVLGNPITTASDTYSLGVLLFLLLTGSLPYELKELTMAEMLRVICEQPPRRPEVAAGSSKRLDGDLEAILAKSMRKEPKDRYLTAQQFSADIAAYLEGRPVAARQGNYRYRTFKFVRRHRFGFAAAALLAATLIAGIAGVLWQARVANQQRRRAEERSQDLRQLSNSLLSELDEAIKNLPGSTGVQKLLVTRVLEHLDRMAKDSAGDRQTQLDLVDAYTRLGNIQGNPYDQNLGDPAGGVLSMDKAIALALPLAPANSTDPEALRGLALAQECRSEILFGAARTGEAIPFMRQAVQNYDRSIASPKATPAQIAAVAAAYGTLGDELGQSGTSSLADSAAALIAFHKVEDLDNRALSIDPNFLRARRGLALIQLKIGSLEMETNPANALKDFQLALARLALLPKEEQTTLATIRMRSMLERKEADALSELSQYPQAEAIFDQVVTAQAKLEAADPDDLRARADLEVVLADEAVAFQDATNPLLIPSPKDRARYLARAEERWMQVVVITEKMLKQDPSNDNWKMVLADAQVRLGTTQTLLKKRADAADIAGRGVATLKDLASKPQASVMLLDQAATDLVRVEPASLKDSQFAVRCAQRAAAQSHRQNAALLLDLSQAYSAIGDAENSSATAKEALALLPSQQAGAAKGNLQRLLEVQAQAVK
jgi:tetratricopeptide (TPR) repeat protein